MNIVIEISKTINDQDVSMTGKDSEVPSRKQNTISLT